MPVSFLIALKYIYDMHDAFTDINAYFHLRRMALAINTHDNCDNQALALFSLFDEQHNIYRQFCTKIVS